MANQPSASEQLDRRTLRSREFLMDALSRLLQRQPFDDISIQEISDEANLTRATFYLHYQDKGALLQAMTVLRFGESLRKRLSEAPSCTEALKIIALEVCEYLAKASGCPSSLGRMSLERSIIPVITEILKEGAERLHLPASVTPELLATTVAWAIFGAASDWAQNPTRLAAEEMADVITTLVTPLWQLSPPPPQKSGRSS